MDREFNTRVSSRGQCPPPKNDSRQEEVRKQVEYAEALKQQIAEKKRLDDVRERGEREDEDVIDKRMEEQSERMEQQYVIEQHQKMDFIQQVAQDKKDKAIKVGEKEVREQMEREPNPRVSFQGSSPRQEQNSDLYGSPYFNSEHPSEGYTDSHHRKTESKVAQDKKDKAIKDGEEEVREQMERELNIKVSSQGSSPRQEQNSDLYGARHFNSDNPSDGYIDSHQGKTKLKEKTPLFHDWNLSPPQRPENEAHKKEIRKQVEYAEALKQQIAEKKRLDDVRERGEREDDDKTNKRAQEQSKRMEQEYVMEQMDLIQQVAQDKKDKEIKVGEEEVRELNTRVGSQGSSPRQEQNSDLYGARYFNSDNPSDSYIDSHQGKTKLKEKTPLFHDWNLSSQQRPQHEIEPHQKEVMKQMEYAEALKQQIAEKKRLDDVREKGEREEDDKIDKRVQEQSERMDQQYLIEQHRKMDFIQQVAQDKKDRAIRVREDEEREQMERELNIRVSSRGHSPQPKNESRQEEIRNQIEYAEALKQQIAEKKRLDDEKNRRECKDEDVVDNRVQEEGIKGNGICD